MYPPTLGSDSKTPILGETITSEDIKENRHLVDVLCGWITKVVCDHVGIGVKSGAPYVHRAVSSVYRDNTTENAENYGLEELLEQAKQPVLARNRRLFEYLQSLLPATLNFGDTKGNVAQGCPGSIFAMEYGELNMAVECVYLKLAENLQERLGEKARRASTNLPVLTPSQIRCGTGSRFGIPATHSYLDCILSARIVAKGPIARE